MTLSPNPGQGNTTIKTGSNRALSESISQYHQDQQYMVQRMSDDTKANMQKVTDATSKEISRYNQTTKNYQEDMTKVMGDIIHTYLDAQRDIGGLIEIATSPYVDKMLFPSFSQERTSQIYKNWSETYVDNIIRASRALNKTVRTYIQASKKSVQLAKENSKELSKIGTNSVKTFNELITIATTAG